MKLILLFSFLISFLFVYANDHYLVYLKDKPNSTNIAIEDYFSSDAIERRKRNNISFDIKDYPVSIQYSKIIGGVTPVRNASKWMNAIEILANENDIEKIKLLTFVEKIEKVKSSKILKKTKSKLETQYNSLYYGFGDQYVQLHHAQTMYDSAYRGQGIKIAVFDDGFINVPIISAFDTVRSYNHLHPVWNYVSNNDSLYIKGGHGTSVLSTMAAYVPTKLVGTATKADFYLFITEDAHSESKLEEWNWALAVEKADSIGIDIINSSLGYSEFDDISTNYTYQNMDGKTTIITKAAETAYQKGILVVNAAGNEGAGPWKYIVAPADGEHVLSVGAVNKDGVRGAFSSQGPTADGRLKPDISALGVASPVVKTDSSFGFSMGTSFASPSMAGLIASFWSMDRNLTNKQVRSIIIESTDKSIEPNNLKGYGIPLFDNAISIWNRNKSVNFVKDFIIYPNPFKDFVNISYDSKTTILKSYTLYDLKGKILAYNNFITSNVDYAYLKLENISLGHYVLKIESNLGTKNFGLLKSEY